jgi:hypothetical protein
MSDPTLHWDGQQWLRWNGEAWVPEPPPPQPARKSRTGVVIAVIAAVVVMALLLGAGGFWLWQSRDKELAGGTGTTTAIATVPINGTQDAFTASVGDGQQITPETTRQQVSVAGGEPGLYGGTRNVATCDRRQLISYLMADQGKGQAWAAVLGLQYEEIPAFVMKLTPMLLRRDTLVTNHGYSNGRATAFTSVLQAGTAVLVGRRGLPVVRCFCGNPLTPPPSQVSGATYTGPTWPGWNPQSITIITQNTTLIDIFVVVDVVTGEEFTRPAGTAGGADGVPGTEVTPPPATEGSGRQVEDVAGFLSAVQNGDYGAADTYCTDAFIGRYGGAANLAPGWGGLTSFQITGSTVGDTFVAVYTEEYWEGGFRQATYYVTKGGGTFIDDADFVDSDVAPPQEYPPDYPEQYPDDGQTPTEEPGEYPSDYPEQYPDEGGAAEPVG